MNFPGSLLLAVLLGAPVSLAGVRAHYSFDSGYMDSSGNGNHGALTDVGTLGNSGITTTAGSHVFGGGAMHFDIERDFIAIDPISFSTSDSYTIAFWSRQTAGDSDAGHKQWDMVLGDRNNNNHFIALGDTAGPTGLRWRGTGSGAGTQADFAVPKDYGWHHYAIVASGGVITLYRDGTLFGEDLNNDTAFNLNTIGEAYGSAGNFDFHGEIDEVWVFDEALGGNAVTGLYQSNDPAAGLEGGTELHHRYDGDFTDSGTLGNNGLPLGGAAITTSANAVVSGSGALMLDGTGDCRVLLTTPVIYAASERWTAAWWARRGEIGASKGMVMGKADNTSDFIYLNDSYKGLRFRSSNATTFDFTAPKDVGLHHYALVADGAGKLSLYLDGLLLESLTGNTSFAIDSIGKAYPVTSTNLNFQGSLDEIHLMRVALSAGQVEQLYQDEKPVVTETPVNRVRVFLIGGQSNADGRAAVSGLPPSLRTSQNDVDFYYKTEGSAATLTVLRPGLSETSQFGPEVLLGRRLADLYQSEAGTRVAIIKYANGGTNLHTQWKAGGNSTTTGDGTEYQVFQQTVTSGLAALAAAHPDAVLELGAMVWMQGEGDATSGPAASYQANLTAFIADVRATYGASLPFIIGRLSDKQTNLSTVYRNLVRAAQDAVAAADPLTGIIDTDGFGLASDNLHFNPDGQQAMGSAFAGEAAYYTWMLDTFTPADIAAGLAEPDADRDGDGQSNRREFLAGTDPLAWSSLFRAGYLRTGPDAGEISYPSSGGRMYRVERYREEDGSWATELPALRGTGNLVVRALDDSRSRGMYRVCSELP